MFVIRLDVHLIAVTHVLPIVDELVVRLFAVKHAQHFVHLVLISLWAQVVDRVLPHVHLPVGLERMVHV